MSAICLKVEGFAGTTIEDACRDLCALADRVGILCEVGFNGVKVWAHPGTDPAQLVKAWGEQMERPAHVYKIASARPSGVMASDTGLRRIDGKPHCKCAARSECTATWCTRGVSGTPAPELVAIGEVNCFDTKGWPIIRRYPSSAKTQIGAQVFVLASGVSASDADTNAHQTPTKD